MIQSIAVQARLLGQASVQVGSGTVVFEADKRYQLLAYLVLQKQWVGRDKLADLFWSNTSTEASRRNLRQLLLRVQELSWLEGLEVERTRLRWLVESDVAAFRQALEANQLEEALTLYSGPLLKDCDTYEDNEFGSWLEVEREGLHSSWREAVLAQAALLKQAAQLDQSMLHLQRLLEQDPFDEEALTAFMHIAAAAGQPGRGLKLYQAFKERLEREMGMEPTSTTQQLAQALTQASSDAPTLLPIPNKASSALPTPSTSFVGRDLELSEIAHLLSQATCRLLTLVGPGGVGKTRLALEVASELLGHFEATAFVALEALNSSGAIPISIAQALGFSLQGAEPPLLQVCRLIGSRHLLLVLDNFEHLIEQTSLVSNLLQLCPKLQLLITSRERLGLEEEHSLPIGGLALPVKGASLEDAQTSEALALFVERARRVQPSFVLSQEELPALQAICSLVQGFPLGLELAAAWVRLMPCAEIAEEISKNLDFLSSTSRNVNERHKSLRATFDYSWRLLSTKEQEALSKLAVFRGGFTREAASFVATANLALLAALVDKSVLRVSARGRYDFHPLVQQYALEHLEGSMEVRERHLGHFLLFAESSQSALDGPQQLHWLHRLDQDYDNLRWALEWAKEHNLTMALRLATALWRYWWTRGYLQEARNYLETLLALPQAKTSVYARALGVSSIMAWAQSDYPAAKVFAQQSLEIEREEQDPQGIAAALSRLGNATHSLREYPATRAAFEEYLSIARQLGDPILIGKASNNLANLLMDLGENAQAQALHQESLGIERRYGAPDGIAISLSNLAKLTLSLGEYDLTRRYLEEATLLAQEVGNGWILAQISNIWGRLALYQKDYTTAEQYFEQTLAQHTHASKHAGMAYALGNLGEVSLRQGNLLEAEARLEEGLRLMRPTGDRKGIAVLLSRLGRLARLQQDPARAISLQQESLSILSELGERNDAVGCFAELGVNWLTSGRLKQATYVLGFAEALLTELGVKLPLAEHEDGEQIKERLKTQLGEAAFEEAWQVGQRINLQQAMAYALEHSG